MTGTEALAAFNLAAKWLKEGKYADALTVKLLPSDRQVIERRIAAAQQAAGAKGTNE